MYSFFKSIRGLGGGVQGGGEEARVLANVSFTQTLVSKQRGGGTHQHPSRRSLAGSEQLHMLLEIQLRTTSSVSTDKTLQETPKLSNGPDLSMKAFPARCSWSQIASLWPPYNPESLFLLLLALQPNMILVFCTRSFQAFLPLTIWLQFYSSSFFINHLYFISPSILWSSFGSYSYRVPISNLLN
jgi:hypothetical protein